MTEISAVERLSGVVAPPERRVGGVGAVIENNLREVGIKLPSDYVEFCQRFGSGYFWFSAKMSVLDLGSANWHVAVGRCVESIRARRDSLFSLAEAAACRLYPDPDGLIPWGCDDFGNVFTWDPLSSGLADRWSVVVSVSTPLLWDSDGEPSGPYDVAERLPVAARRVEAGLSQFLVRYEVGMAEFLWLMFLGMIPSDVYVMRSDGQCPSVRTIDEIPGLPGFLHAQFISEELV
ncbi:MAG: SMI1/KNR4 family protein [Planctomycetales bacterium]